MLFRTIFFRQYLPYIIQCKCDVLKADDYIILRVHYPRQILKTVKRAPSMIKYAKLGRRNIYVCMYVCKTYRISFYETINLYIYIYKKKINNVNRVKKSIMKKKKYFVYLHYRCRQKNCHRVLGEQGIRNIILKRTKSHGENHEYYNKKTRSEKEKEIVCVVN